MLIVGRRRTSKGAGASYARPPGHSPRIARMILGNPASMNCFFTYEDREPEALRSNTEPHQAAEAPHRRPSCATTKSSPKHASVSGEQRLSPDQEAPRQEDRKGNNYGPFASGGGAVNPHAQTSFQKVFPGSETARTPPSKAHPGP